MKITVSMKCPDALDQAINDATDTMQEWAEIKKLCEKWFKWGEYVTLEIDTDAGTCIVLEV
jgi:ABC-type amino acid transport substrate-binding protein